MNAWEKVPPSGRWLEAPQQAAVSLHHVAPTQLMTVGTEGTYQYRGIDDGKVVAKLKSPTNASCTDSQKQDPARNLRRDGGNTEGLITVSTSLPGPEPTNLIIAICLNQAMRGNRGTEEKSYLGHMRGT